MEKQYTQDSKGTLTDNTNGEVYPHRFKAWNRCCWADARSAELGFTRTNPNEPIFKFELVEGEWKPTKRLKASTTIEAGTFISPDPEHIAINVELGPPSDVERLRLPFEQRTYKIDEASLRSLVTKLPDGRLLTFLPPGNDSIQLRPAAIVPSADLFGLAVAIHADGSAVELAQSSSLEVVTGEQLVELFDDSPDALDADAHEGAVINLPIKFWTMGVVDKGGDLLKYPARVIPLARFRVPDWFGSPSDDDDDGNPRERWAYFGLTTAGGVMATDRDERATVPAGTVVWIDEKYDLRGLAGHLPRFEKGKCVRASEFILTPIGKFPFKKTKGGTVLTYSAWRIQTKWVGVIRHPDLLRKLAMVRAQCPAIPWRPGDGDIETGEGEFTEEASFPTG